MASVSARRTNGTIRKVAIPMTLILAIGTGGDHTHEYQRIREARLVVGATRPADKLSDVISVATAASDLSRIRAVLKLSTTDLAKVLGVKRQSIYNWQSGSHIKSDNLSKLANLKSAADTFIRARITLSPMLLDRVLPNGKTLLESIKGGEDGAAAANSLVALLSQEAEQRAALDLMLAENVSRDSDRSDYGAPAFNEG